jgi:hypothetical protein
VGNPRQYEMDIFNSDVGACSSARHNQGASIEADWIGKERITMISLNTSTPSAPIERPASVPVAPPPKSDASSKPGTDVVQISGAAASAAKAAAQEATETADQTAKEARGGDQQAQRLMARYAAEKAAR